MIVEVKDQSQIAAARRAAADLAKALGADELAMGKVAIVASEMASNLLKHTPRGGRILLEPYDDHSGSGLELIALDSGGGIGDVPRAMADGYSTAGTSGGGLGAIQRQADDFAVFSRPGQGTAILARCRFAEGARANVILGLARATYPGETVSGDAWAFAPTAAGPTLMVVDGSGHGLQAHDAAEAAVTAFRASAEESCPRLVETIHRAMAPTRGGAVAVARIDEAERKVRFVGIGNIAAASISGTDVKRMVSHNGIAGLGVPRIREFTYPYAETPMVVLQSDGVSARWDLGSYPGLAFMHPGLVAAVLFRDHWRGRDDGIIATLRPAP